MSIPKVIHYCWFGGNPLPEKDKKNIEKWKSLCPDYEIKRWDESNYDYTKNEYMLQAYNSKKWGFVTDYARLDIIYENGGIYFDTDVEVVKSFDDLLECHGFMGIEKFSNEFFVNSGIGFGAEKNNSVIFELLKMYNNVSFVSENGNLNLKPCPYLLTEKLCEFGLLRNNKFQIVENINIYPNDFFAPKDYITGKVKLTSQTHSIHQYAMSWVSDEQKEYQYKLKKYSKIFGSNGAEYYIALQKKLKKLLGR